MSAPKKPRPRPKLPDHFGRHPVPAPPGRTVHYWYNRLLVAERQLDRFFPERRTGWQHVLRPYFEAHPEAVRRTGRLIALLETVPRVKVLHEEDPLLCDRQGSLCANGTHLHWGEGLRLSVSLDQIRRFARSSVVPAKKKEPLQKKLWGALGCARMIEGL